MPYNKSVARPAYYKIPATTLAQLEKICVRLCANSNMSYRTKQSHIAKQFLLYNKHLAENC
jgi:hypothetical protein